MLSFLWVLIVGLAVGAIAKLLVPGKDPGGIIVTMLLGVAGAFIATFVGKALGWYEPDEAAGFIGSIVGAVVVLLIYRSIVGWTGRRRVT